jgi:uncharacterized protein (DUF433 family)
MSDTIVMSINYIVKTPGICSGDARIDGTRITVHWIIGLIQQGWTVEDLIKGYSHIPLTRAQIHAAQAYYYDHKQEIDKLIAETDQMAAEAQQVSSSTPKNGGEFITAEEAAELLGVSHQSRRVAQLCRDGKLECRKVANRWMVSRQSAEAYAKSNRNPGRKPSAA